MESSMEEARELRVGELVLDGRGQRVWAGAWHVLTPTEYRILRCLMESPGTICSAEELARRVWGYEGPGCLPPPPLRWHVRNLRRKVEPDPESPRVLRNLPWRGYLIDPEGATGWGKGPPEERETWRVPRALPPLPERERGARPPLARWAFRPRRGTLWLDGEYRRLLELPGEGELEMDLGGFLERHVCPEDRAGAWGFLSLPQGEGKEGYREGEYRLVTAEENLVRLSHWAWTRWSAGGRLVQAYGASQLLVRGEASEGQDGVSVRDALAILAEVGGRFPARGGPELVGRVFQAMGCCMGASSGLWLDFLPGSRMRVRSHWWNLSLLPAEALLFVSPHVPWLRSLRRGEPVILDSFGGPRPSSSLGRRFTGDGNRASLALPIPSSAKAVRGFFLLAWEGGERIWDESERAVLRLLAGWAGRMGSLSPRRPRPESIHPETSWGLPSEPPGRSSSDPFRLPPKGAGGKVLRSQGT